MRINCINLRKIAPIIRAFVQTNVYPWKSRGHLLHFKN